MPQKKKKRRDLLSASWRSRTRRSPPFLPGGKWKSGSGALCLTSACGGRCSSATQPLPDASVLPRRASVVIRPHISPSVVAAAIRCVPTDVLPRVDDSCVTLAQRLGASTFLDDAHVLNAGNGKRGKHGQKRRRLNTTYFPAPRRKSWSVVVREEEEKVDGVPVVSLFNYSAYGRLAEDVRCAPMPLPVFSLGEQLLWLAAKPYLCEESRRSPPTHCQLRTKPQLLNKAPITRQSPELYTKPRLLHRAPISKQSYNY